ncbi:MAG: hypothetical protein JO263_12565 [Candidatus Eremiobacteraeota bacterium]|nr:hypothetical protein [Candidatus Eremiobacteraeota bacterium]
MNPQISSGAFDAFFAWAPWVIGIIIYLVFYVAKRHENATAHAPRGTPEPTYACAGCGRRGPRDQMIATDHGGAVGWYCPTCASQTAAVH